MLIGSGDEITDEDSLQDDSSHGFLSQMNFFDVVDNFFNPVPPQVSFLLFLVNNVGGGVMCIVLGTRIQHFNINNLNESPVSAPFKTATTTTV